MTRALRTYLNRIAIDAARDGVAKRRRSSMLGSLTWVNLVQRTLLPPRWRHDRVRNERLPPEYNVRVTPSGERFLDPQVAALFRLGEQRPLNRSAL